MVAAVGRCGVFVQLSVPSMPVVVVFGEVGWARRRGLCVVCDGYPEPLAPSGDVIIAAEILIDDALAERPSTPVAVGGSAFSGDSGHWRFVSLIGWGTASFVAGAG